MARRLGPDPALSASRKPGWLPWLKGLVPFVGLVSAVVMLLLIVDVGAVVSAIGGAELTWVGAAAGLALCATVIVALKLYAVVRIVDQPRSFRDTWSAVMAGLTLNAVLPGRGGDLVRAVFLTRDAAALPVLLGAVLVERLFDVFTLGVLVLLTGVGLDLITLAAVGVCAAALGGGALLALLGPRSPIRPDLGERLSRTALLVVKRPLWSLMALCLSLLAWMNNAALMLFAMRAVGVDIPAFDALRGIAVAILAGIIPVTISGIGTRDTALVLMLEPFGQADHVAAAGLIYTALVYWFLAIIGSFALGRETLRAIREQVAQRKADAAPASSQAATVEASEVEG